MKKKTATETKPRRSPLSEPERQLLAHLVDAESELHFAFDLHLRERDVDDKERLRKKIILLINLILAIADEAGMEGIQEHIEGIDLPKLNQRLRWSHAKASQRN